MDIKVVRTGRRIYNLQTDFAMALVEGLPDQFECVGAAAPDPHSVSAPEPPKKPTFVANRSRTGVPQLSLFLPTGESFSYQGPMEGAAAAFGPQWEVPRQVINAYAVMKARG